MTDTSAPRSETARLASEPRAITWMWRVTFALTTALILAAHVHALGALPRGLYIDESSIGLNAATIAEAGVDEHGVLWPVFFKAFGEYKNPVYVYAVALAFRIAGPSEASLRATSFVFFLLELGASLALARALWPGRRIVSLFMLIAVGLMPQHFNLSRVGFEVIAQPAFVLFALWCVHRAFEREVSPRSTLVFAALAGASLGLSTYAYSTARLLSTAMLGVILLLHARPARWRAASVMVAAFGTTLVPYLAFARAHPGALTKRFEELSYVTNTNLPLGEKVQRFLDNYFEHFTMKFLVLHGDANARHTTGLGGIVFWAVLILAAVGLVQFLTNDALRRSRVTWLILAGLVLAPAAAALTEQDTPHALRSFLLGNFLTLVACQGLVTTRALPGRKATALTVALFALLGWESQRYLRHYFGEYRDVSARAFESAGYPESLARAVAENPSRVLVKRTPYGYAHLAFYRRVLGVDPDRRIEISDDLPGPGECWVTPPLRRRPRIRTPSSLVERSPGSVFGVECFGTRVADR